MEVIGAVAEIQPGGDLWILKKIPSIETMALKKIQERNHNIEMPGKMSVTQCSSNLRGAFMKENRVCEE